MSPQAEPGDPIERLGPWTLFNLEPGTDNPVWRLRREEQAMSERPDTTPAPIEINLYWIPLGAGGTGFVRMNGRVYEAIVARAERRQPLDLYHTALDVGVSQGRFVVETMWPSPGGDPASRGVVVEAPVFARWMARTRVFRYEVRCWQDGILPDRDQAVGGARTLSRDLETARHLLELTESVPAYTWGRDPSKVGDMWNSNSVISWLLTRSGLPIETFQPPAGGRAPGWRAGIAVALAQEPSLSV
jgi:hypothetical protein